VVAEVVELKGVVGARLGLSPDASVSDCACKFIDRGAAGFPEPPGGVGTAMCGCGSVAVLKALIVPLGSTVTLFIPQR